MSNPFGSVGVNELLTAKHHFQAAHNSALVAYYHSNDSLKEHHFKDMLSSFEKAAMALGYTLAPIVTEAKADEVSA